MTEQIKRAIAHRISIAELNKGKYVEQEGWQPNYVELNEQKISRVVIEGLFSANVSLTANTAVQGLNASVKDASGTMQVRSFDTVTTCSDVSTNDTVRVVGKVKKYQDSLYIVPEIIRKISGSVIVPDGAQKNVVAVEHKKIPIVEHSPAISPISGAKIIDLIESLDTGNGAAKSQIVDELKKMGVVDPDKKLHNLMLSGDIFEMRPDMIKVLK